MGLDVVVTVPKGRWSEWLDEGDLAAAEGLLEPVPWEGRLEYGFTFTSGPPRIEPGARVYVVAHGRLRGYAPLAYIDHDGTRFGGRPGSWALVRRGGAVACTIAEPVRGFQGWRYRWWEREDEIPFPDWRTEGVD